MCACVCNLSRCGNGPPVSKHLPATRKALLAHLMSILLCLWSSQFSASSQEGDRNPLREWTWIEGGKFSAALEDVDQTRLILKRGNRTKAFSCSMFSDQDLEHVRKWMTGQVLKESSTRFSKPGIQLSTEIERHGSRIYINGNMVTVDYKHLSGQFVIPAFYDSGNLELRVVEGRREGDFSPNYKNDRSIGNSGLLPGLPPMTVFRQKAANLAELIKKSETPLSRGPNGDLTPESAATVQSSAELWKDLNEIPWIWQYTTKRLESFHIAGINIKDSPGRPRRGESRPHWVRDLSRVKRSEELSRYKKSMAQWVPDLPPGLSREKLVACHKRVSAIIESLSFLSRREPPPGGKATAG